MMLCGTCRLKMRVTGKGIALIVDDDEDMVYPADHYECSACNCHVYRVNNAPFHDPGHTKFIFYKDMR